MVSSSCDMEEKEVLAEHCPSYVRKWMRANARNFKTATELAEAAEDSLGFPPDFLDDESHWIWQEAFLAMEALYV